MKKIGRFSFGDTRKESDDLLRLVINGAKTATSSLYESYKQKNIPLPKKGEKSIVADYGGREKCLIKITNVRIKPFGKISESFAKKEGEGDKSLEYWKKTHEKFFEKRLKKYRKKLDKKTLIVCQEFKVIKIL